MARECRHGQHTDEHENPRVIFHFPHFSIRSFRVTVPSGCVHKVLQRQ
jgi:hypothetical protein